MDLSFQVEIKTSDVLVVDDNIINQKVLSKVLESQGFNVIVAADGQEALDQVKIKQPDIVLLDVEMPLMNGFEACRRLKADEETAHIPVIFITAKDTVEGALEGFEAGAVDYITRPLQMPEVLARVETQLMITKLQREANEERDRLELILGSLPLPYFISCAEDGSIVEMNGLAETALNIVDKDVVDVKSLDFYLSKPVRKKLQTILNKKGRVSNEEIEMKTLDGSTFTALISATPMTLEGKDVIFVTFSDISGRKAMERELEKAASTDYLTGVLNRRAFSVRAVAERKRADRNGHPLSFMMIDIDHFKRINDTYGHDVGDAALKAMVDVVGYGLRLSDVLGRFGGEEFALVLPETEYNGACILADRIRHRVEDFELKIEDGTIVKMTISGGLVLWEEGMSYEDAVKIADERLYEAKNSGRNKIVS